MKVDKIFLEGFMGCGKSTFGRKLAAELEWDFIDLDDYIEEKEGRSISDIFEKEGESFFRELETKTLEETRDWTNTVISCGGGTPCFNDNAERINQLGYSVYIKLPASVLKGRLIGEKAKRPLLAKLTDEELLTFIQYKLAEREPFYTKAKKIFEYSDEAEKSFVKDLRSILT